MYSQLNSLKPSSLIDQAPIHGGKIILNYIFWFNWQFFFNSNVLDNKDTDLLNKESVVHYSSIVVDVAETVARAITRIVLIEDRNTSLKVSKQYVYMMSC